jgi:malate synthase
MAITTKINPVGAQGGPGDGSLVVRGKLAHEDSKILTPDALKFVADLERRFGPERRRLMAERVERQKQFDDGALPNFCWKTLHIRQARWRVKCIPHDLQDRRVEITGPVERKMVINALNSGAKVFMADFEDSCAPTWRNIMDGQCNLRDAVDGSIDYTDPKSGKHYSLNDQVAVLIARPRGWHLTEDHVLLDGQPISASLFDFGLYVYHNFKTLMAKGTRPYFYLPKMENHAEAQLWDDVFVAAQKALGMKIGTIKATVLIETFPAAFEMDEILYALRRHIVGLNCGRWDYIFSFIKCLRNHAQFTLPDRSLVTMDRGFLQSYSRLLVQTCHRRGVHAMGGMAAQIPIRNDEEANAAALAKVHADKEREVKNGHDGTWVAHPGLIPVVLPIFDKFMPAPNQIDMRKPDHGVDCDALYALHDGAITERGLRENISVGIQYIESWLRGSGCVPLNNLMEDAATAEISRSQVWQWMRHGAELDDGRTITEALFRTFVDEEMGALQKSLGDIRFAGGAFDQAINLFTDMSSSESFADFLTIPAYQHIVQTDD